MPKLSRTRAISRLVRERRERIEQRDERVDEFNHDTSSFLCLRAGFARAMRALHMKKVCQRLNEIRFLDQQFTCELNSYFMSLVPQPLR
jgi:hypothetical protein